MSDAWRTEVHREVEWDERARAEALGAIYAEKIACPNCGQIDSVTEVLDPAGREARFEWPANADGNTAERPRAYTIRTFRCVSCAGLAVAARVAAAKEKAAADRPDNQVAPGDGTWTVPVEHYPH